MQQAELLVYISETIPTKNDCFVVICPSKTTRKHTKKKKFPLPTTNGYNNKKPPFRAGYPCREKTHLLDEKLSPCLSTFMKSWSEIPGLDRVPPPSQTSWIIYAPGPQLFCRCHGATFPPPDLHVPFPSTLLLCRRRLITPTPQVLINGSCELPRSAREHVGSAPLKWI